MLRTVNREPEKWKIFQYKKSLDGQKANYPIWANKKRTKIKFLTKEEYDNLIKNNAN